MLLGAAGLALLVLLDERRGAALLAAAARLDPRARSGMRECRLALARLVAGVAGALSVRARAVAGRSGGASHASRHCCGGASRWRTSGRRSRRKGGCRRSCSLLSRRWGGVY